MDVAENPKFDSIEMSLLLFYHSFNVFSFSCDDYSPLSITATSGHSTTSFPSGSEEDTWDRIGQFRICRSTQVAIIRCPWCYCRRASSRMISNFEATVFLAK